jgi:hypothetical protein
MDLKLPLEDSPYLLDEHGPVFILGCPRSGTTFLSEAIGLIEEVEEFLGILAPPRLLHLIGSSAARGEDVEDMLLVMRDVFWQSFWRRRYLRRERLMEVLRGRRTPRSLLEGPRLEGALFGYKEPFLCFAMEQVAGHFPKSRFVHIIRDGRDAADSLDRTYPDALSDRVLADETLVANKGAEIGVHRLHDRYHLPWWVPCGEEARFIACSRYGRYIWMWKDMVSRALKCGHSLDKQRYLELRYESVLTRPVETARQIVDFLDVKPSRRLLGRLKRCRPGTIGVARRRQPQASLDEANEIAGGLLQKLGYDL